MVVVRCDTLLCATHRVAAAPAALATGTGRPVALRDMRGRHTRSLGAAGLDWVVSKLDWTGQVLSNPHVGDWVALVWGGHYNTWLAVCVTKLF